ncbi:Flp family type IVb pilin [Rhizobium sp. S-51]|jgi:pilus assembly protein Flp/PilA|uniref:Flp family type IVb pilin n=1 Tax=Rhizobium terricola TaxID=2728849 RepID=A0A7Y0AYN8_9HYPH|nr:Flp family type IVb pilin [Rhizobium terricola]NML75934.1 Flp family type IVb pilin [Rhizobium terricola]
MHLVRKFFADNRAATAVEYGLMAALISVALIGGYGQFADSLMNVFGTVETSVNGAGN